MCMACAWHVYTQVDQDRRPSAKQLLQHPWVAARATGGANAAYVAMLHEAVEVEGALADSKKANGEAAADGASPAAAAKAAAAAKSSAKSA